jgi:putative alpha-1,2-mannosidase
LGAFGFCGNEDVGQLSAWYTLSAMGFAQICPSDKKYYINTPLFENITLSLDKNYHSCNVSSTLEIRCDKDPNEYPYIKEIKLNGNKITVPYLTYEEITGGGVVEFTLSNKSENTFGE